VVATLAAAIVRAGPGAAVRLSAGLGAFWHSTMELLACREVLAYNKKNPPYMGVRGLVYRADM